jgi:protein SCO1/2
MIAMTSIVCRFAILAALAFSGRSIFNLDSSWISQEGRPVELASLAGKPTVIVMAYTSCKAACPMTMKDLRAIERGLSSDARAGTRFAVVSFDSSGDTPERLKKFAQAHDLDLGRWVLLTGREGAVRGLAAVLGIKYKKNARGIFDHSNAISIVDREGVIRWQQQGLGADPGESVKKIEELFRDKK